jgi:hypothetical protein
LKSAVLLAIVLVLGLQPPAIGQDFHNYSHAIENSSPPYFGNRTTRFDVDVSCPGTSAVYQPVWVLITSDAKNWVEGGTGHCNHQAFGFASDPYWYWGYGSSGSWVWMGTRQATQGQSHKFTVTREDTTSACYWRFYVDVTLIGSIRNWCASGAYVDAGLESYATGAGVPVHDVNVLRARTSAGWVAWAGKDSSRVDPEMCGRWVDGDTWRAAQNNPC